MMVSLLERTFLLSVQAMWHAALLAALVGAVCWLFRRWLAPQWKLCLWSLVLLRLALPFVPPSLLAVFPSLPQTSWPQFAALDAAPQVVTSVAESSASPTSFPAIDPATIEQPIRNVPLASVSSIPASLSKPIPASPKAAWSWTGVAIAAWLLGSLLLLLRQCVLLLILRRRRSQWETPRDSRLLRIWQECQRLIDFRGNVELLMSDDMAGPATAGIFKPCIVIPRELPHSLSDDELSHVLLHELAHVKRRDLITLRCASLIACVQWFNPIAWLAWARTCYELELACDESVLRLLDTDERTSYGRTVLRVVEHFTMPPTVGVTGFGSKKILNERIQQIADYRFRSSRVTLLSGLLIAMLALAGLASASPQDDKKADDNRSDATAKSDEGSGSVAATQPRELRGRFTNQDRPVPNVDVKLYVVDRSDRSTHLLQTARSDKDGGFLFDGLPEVDGDMTRFALVATKPGRGSIIRGYITPDELEEPLKYLEMPEAATVSGRVVDDKGKPVAGADVWLQDIHTGGPVEGVLHAKSNADGRFEIKDARAWKPQPPRDLPDGGQIVAGPAFFSAKSKGFGLARPTYNESPTDAANVTLIPEAIITGRVLDDGKPVAGILVSTQGREFGWAEVLTDANGEYRFEGLGSGKCNIWANPTEDKTCAAVDSLEAVAGKTVKAPDIQLVSGGWIEGIVVDQLGNPVSTTAQQPAEQHGFDDELGEDIETPPTPHSVGLHGPARPKSGAAIQSFPVKADGTFRFRVPPGKNWPYICTGWNTGMRVLDETGDQVKGSWLEVASGETRRITILYPTKQAAEGIGILDAPPEGPPADDVILPAPVKEEARIADWIRHFGGWYEVDGSEHIVSVNMVYHNDESGKRHDNPQRNTSALLQHLPGLSTSSISTFTIAKQPTRP